MTSLQVICGLGPPQAKILATPIMSTPSLREIVGVIYVIYYQYCHDIKVWGFTVVMVIGSFLVCCGCCSCWQVAQLSKPSSVTCSWWNLVLSQSQLLQTGMWKRKLEAVKFFWKRRLWWKRLEAKRTRKRPILSGAGSGSKKSQRWENGSIKLQQEQEAEAL